jgi:hypothetical protein
VGATLVWEADPAPRDTAAARVAARSDVGIANAGSPHAPPSSWSSDAYPASFTAAESGRTALERLMLGIEIAALPRSSALTLRALSSADAADWQIANLLQMENCEDEPAPNWVRLQGDGRYADAVDAESVARTGPALALITDLSATTDAQATAHAAAELRKAQVSARKGTLTVPFHAGIELWDVIELTESRYGLESEAFRVVALAARFDRSSAHTARYDTVATLGGV